MLRRFTALLSVAAVLALVPVVVAGQAQKPPEKKVAVAKAASAREFVPKRTPWGDPDITGNFTTKDEMNTPFERPDEFAGRRVEDITPQELAAAVAARKHDAVASAPYAGGGSRQLGVALGVPIHWLDNLDANNSRPWLVVDPPDGKVPPTTEEARKRATDRAKLRQGRGTADSFTDRSSFDRCIARGAPSMTAGLYGASHQILQTKDFIAIRYEMIDETRIIPIDGRGSARPHVSQKIRSYFGDATARWEGNTLVVDTTNFNGVVSYRGSDESLHMVERFTRTAPNKVELTVTVEDPHTWARPWSYAIPLTEDDGQPIFEYACHEGNYGLRNILSAGRSDDRKGIKSSNNADSQADLNRGELDE